MSVVVVAGRTAEWSGFSSDRFDVRSRLLLNAHDYHRFLVSFWWERRVVVNVEQDMEFSDRLVQDLLDCPHPLCTHAYPIYFKSQKRWVYSPTRGGMPIRWREPWADRASLGFCKMVQEARPRLPAPATWKFLEHSVCDVVGERNWQLRRPALWHVHWPEVGHFHDYDGEHEWSDWERFAADAGVPCHVLPSERRGCDG